MKDAREKLLSHILLVVAPLLVLLMLTVAWFINSRTIGMSEMSFAAKDAGPGAVLYPYETLGTRRYDKATDSAAATLTYSSITWGAKLLPEKSDITIENMLPGQCEYYLLVSEKKFTPRLMNIVLKDADGNIVTTEEENKKLLLTQCLGLYLVDTNIDLKKDPQGQVDPDVEIELIRSGDQKLSAAVFAGTPQGIALPRIEAKDAKTAYILAVFCDGVYGQNGPGSQTTHVGTLPGTISFSLAFDLVEET